MASDAPSGQPGNVLITAEQLEQRVAELGAELSEAYRGTDLLLVGILKGAVIFLADLMRHLTVPAEIDFMAVSSYGASTDSSGVVRILKDLDVPIEGRHVVIVEDIVDTGLTLSYLVRSLRARSPASLAVCTLLDKPGRRRVELEIAHSGFEIPDEYVVGYGLDAAQLYRTLPEIAVWNPGPTA
ncbi:MAG: hypoxanthine phosphoribosyltransferase [Solirubrobacterales bacterium]